MEILSEGATARILIDPVNSDYVYKVYKKHKNQSDSLKHELEIHREVEAYLLNDLELQEYGVEVPELSESTHYYRMKRIDTSQPLYDEIFWNSLSPNAQSSYIWRIRIVLKILSHYGLSMKDVEAYLQPNNVIMLIDFGQAYRIKKSHTFQMESAAILPYSVTSQWLHST